MSCKLSLYIIKQCIFFPNKYTCTRNTSTHDHVQDLHLKLTYHDEHQMDFCSKIALHQEMYLVFRCNLWDTFFFNNCHFYLCNDSTANHMYGMLYTLLLVLIYYIYISYENTLFLSFLSLSQGVPITIFSLCHHV